MNSARSRWPRNGSTRSPSRRRRTTCPIWPAAYRASLAGARQWLGDYFELSSPGAQALLEQIQQLEPIEIDPQLPDISGSARALQRLLPAMGYSEEQRLELEETINRTPCELVLVATPVDLGRLLHLDMPSLRVSYEIDERTRPTLHEILEGFTARCQRAAVA